MLQIKRIQNKYMPYCLAFLISLLVFLGFFHVCNYGFTTGEEYWFTQNFTWNDIKQIFTQNTWPSYGIYYRPLVQSSYAIDFQLWGYNEFGYHFDTLLLYAALCGLIFILLFFLFGSWLIPSIATGFFVFYPPHAHQISLVTHRGDTIPLIFLCAICLNLIKTRNRTLRISLNTLFLLLSFFSKENTVIFIGIMLFVEFFRNDFRIKKCKFSALAEYAFYAILTLLFLWFRLVYLPQRGILEKAGINLSPFAFIKGTLVNGKFTLFTTESYVAYPFHLTASLILWTILLWKICFRHLPVKYSFLAGIPCIVLHAAGILSIFYSYVVVYCVITLLYLLYLAWPGFESAMKFLGFRSLPDQFTLKTFILGFGWILISNIVMVSKFSERLVFNASVGVAILIALLIYMILKDSRALHQKTILFAFIGLYSVFYIQAAHDRITAFSPDTYFAHMLQLVWYPALEQGEIWPGRKSDHERIKTLREYLLKYRLIDTDNRLLVKEEWLEDLAYSYLDSHKINQILYGFAAVDQRPQYLNKLWNKAGWEISD